MKEWICYILAYNYLENFIFKYLCDLLLYLCLATSDNDQECDVLFVQELFVAKSNTQVMHTENKLNVSAAIVFSAFVFSFSSVRF